MSQFRWKPGQQRQSGRKSLHSPRRRLSKSGLLRRYCRSCALLTRRYRLTLGWQQGDEMLSSFCPFDERSIPWPRTPTYAFCAGPSNRLRTCSWSVPTFVRFYPTLLHLPPGKANMHFDAEEGAFAGLKRGSVIVCLIPRLGLEAWLGRPPAPKSKYQGRTLGCAEVGWTIF